MTTAHLTIAGLGPGGLNLLSGESLEVLTAAPVLILRTGWHPAAEELRAQGVSFSTLDPLYDQAASFEELYPRLAEAVLRVAARGPVVYAVPGNPLVGEESVRILIRAAAEKGLSTRAIPAMSFVDVVAPALLAAGIVPELDQWQVADGAALDRVWWDVGHPALVFQVHDGAAASRVKLALQEEYPDDCEVCVVHRAGVPGQETVARVPLYELDRPRAGEYGYLTTLYVPPLPADRRRPGFGEFVQVIDRLRAPDGCPWDREQDYRSLKRFVLEEAYELLEAIEDEDPARLCDELGDLMLQVLLYAQIAKEDGYFDIRDVVGNIVSKLIRRHPHVFGDVSVETAEEVRQNWDAIKRQEKPERTSALDGVPKELPALMKALEVSKRAVRVGFEWPALDAVLDKLDEEVTELKAELPEPAAGSEGDETEADREKLRGEIGDLLFTVVNVARWLKIDPEEALREMVDRFSRRFREMERLAAAEGRPLTGRDIMDLDALWEQAKANLAG
jgi:tetrapyrrole methylase family protein / MazG family protein